MSQKMTTDLLTQLIEHAETSNTGYFELCHVIACNLDKKLHEQLQSLLDGPVWDGNIIHKGYRDELLSLGLAIRVCHKGEQGYTGASYLAFTVMKAANDIKSGKIGA